jgi:TRAP-type C4-dicarboxylate transport system substrate-binding protein
MQELADRVKKASDGRIEITVYPGGTLAASTEALDAVKTGAADMGWIYTTFFRGQFKITEAASLPLLGIKTSTQSANVLWDLYADSEALRKELNTGFKTLALYSNPNNFIVTKSKPVKTVADLQGLKLRATTGTATDMLIAWGGTPIAMGPGDIYQAMDKNVIDGCIWEYHGLSAFKVSEVANYYTEIPIFVGPFLIIMNNDSFNSLPDDLKKIIEDETGRAYSMELAASFQKVCDIDRADIEKNAKNTIIEPAGDDLAGFEQAADKYIEDWVAANKSADFDAEAYVNKIRELVEKYKDR